MTDINDPLRIDLNDVGVRARAAAGSLAEHSCGVDPDAVTVATGLLREASDALVHAAAMGRTLDDTEHQDTLQWTLREIRALDALAAGGDRDAHALSPQSCGEMADGLRRLLAAALRPKDALTLPEVGYTTTELATLLNEGADAWAELTEDGARETEGRLREVAHALLEAGRRHPRLTFPAPNYSPRELSDLLIRLADLVVLARTGGKITSPEDGAVAEEAHAVALHLAVEPAATGPEGCRVCGAPATVLMLPDVSAAMERAAAVLTDDLATDEARQQTAESIAAVAATLNAWPGDDTPAVANVAPERDVDAVEWPRVRDLIGLLYSGWRMAIDDQDGRLAGEMRRAGSVLLDMIREGLEGTPAWRGMERIDKGWRTGHDQLEAPMVTGGAAGLWPWGPPHWETLATAAERFRVAAASTTGDPGPWLAMAARLDTIARELRSQALTEAQRPCTEPQLPALARLRAWAWGTASNALFAASKGAGRRVDRATGAEPQDDETWDDSR